MGRPKGTIKTGGRVVGSKNHATSEFKDAVNKLLSYSTPKMVNWLDSIAQTDPSKALEHVYKFAQFGYPLLSRTEMKHEGELTLNQILANIDDPDRR